MTGIFKAYDIRGIFPSEINEDNAYYIGRAVSLFLKEKEIIVGRDGRKSSLPLFNAVVKGINSTGTKVIDIGLCSTPLFYYVSSLGYAGIMITASHNPPEYNGFKICAKGAMPIGAHFGMEKIEKIYEKDKNRPKTFVEENIEKRSFLSDYVKKSLSLIKFNKKYRVVVDAANGMGGIIYGELMKKTEKIEIVPLYFNLDCSYPNHEANPIKVENLKDIRKIVVKERCDLGVALDGDADRIVFIDEKGKPVRPDIITAIIARDILKEEKGAKILYDVRSSKIIPNTIKKYGGKAIEYKVGHSFIKRKMKTENISFGGELSGHYYHKEANYMENTVMVLLKILNIVDKEKKRLSSLVREFKKYSKIEETNFIVKDLGKVIKKIKDFYEKKAKKIHHIDGLKIEFNNWWFNLRESHTEPLLRLNLEADNSKIMRKKFNEIKKLIKKFS